MPDDMLEDAITIAKKTLDEHDFESQGVDVSKLTCPPFEPLILSSYIHSYLTSSYRLQDL